MAQRVPQPKQASRLFDFCFWDSAPSLVIFPRLQNFNPELPPSSPQPSVIFPRLQNFNQHAFNRIQLLFGNGEP